MAKALSAWAQTQQNRHSIVRTHRLLVDGQDRSNYLLSWNVSYDREFGSASATIILVNGDAQFEDGGSLQIDVGDSVQLFEKYQGDTTEWKRFYGFVVQRSVSKSARERTISLTCLDFISKLQALDIDLIVQGQTVGVEDEVLIPNFLPPPNSSLAQIFNFSKTGLSDHPEPIIMIHDLTNELSHPQFDGFEVLYEQGQLRLGSPLNAFTNYEIIARSYYYYVRGVYAEDVLEQVLIQPDGYGKFLFGEATAQAVIDNHLTDTFQNVEGAVNDAMLANLSDTIVRIYHQLSANVAVDATTINLDSTEGFPTSGSGEINGDLFSWTGKSSTTLTGCTGLKAHLDDDWVIYENTYEAGRLWYLTYSNVQDELSDGVFTGVPSGTSIDYFDKRFGRIILSAAIPTTTTVQCTANYEFKTLQASGIELNRISFRSRELENRYEAVQKLRGYLSPNYLIRTQGDDRIWSGYVTQKVVADYTLSEGQIESVNSLEDEDLYTRTIMYTKNNNPRNIMFNTGVDFVSSGISFKAVTNDTQLALIGEEGNYYVYGTLLSGVGAIDPSTITPVVRVNGIAIDNQIHQLFQQPVLVELTTKTETRTGCHGISKEQYFKSHTYFYYKIFFAHTNLVASQPILLHNANGTTLVTISANDPNMDYARGVYHVPNTAQNDTYTQLSSATYFINYSTNLLLIDFDNIFFKVDKSLIISPSETIVTATYEYFATFTNVFDVASIIDGRFDTQVQTEFFTEPPSGLPFAIIDLGATYPLQAIDIVAGFYRPDSNRKFDIDMRFDLKYSLDNVDYFNIGDTANNIRLTGGDSISLEEDDLGSAFQARYLRIDLQNVKRIDFGNGIWPVAFTELAAYNDIILKGEATLIPTTSLTSGVTTGSTTVNVVSTVGFPVPESAGAPLVAYIEEDTFTYEDVTATSFIGVTGISSSHSAGARVHEIIESDTTMYDDDGLLPKLGDKIYKDNLISENALYSQSQTDFIAKAFLREFYKQHTRRRVEVNYAPYLNVGQTVSLYGIRYFIESVEEETGRLALVLARYPG